jgi:curved DNA-binding protein
VAKDKKRAEEKFKEINEAYEVLSDPAKRKKYDELGENWQAGPGFRGGASRPGFPGNGARWQSGPGRREAEFEFGGGGFSSFFEQMFGSRPGNQPGFGRAANGGGRGQDIEADLVVTLEEAMRGSQREISVRHRVGQKIQTDTHQVKIPAGVTEGQKLRLAGRGEAAANGGEAGDLYLRVRLARHPDFEVDGHNLIHETELALWEAVLGTELLVPTLEGRVKIKIAPGTQAGQKLRVRAQGLAQRDGTRGDLIVVARVALPAKLPDNERKLWEQLARESKFNPRD